MKDKKGKQGIEDWGLEQEIGTKFDHTDRIEEGGILNKIAHGLR